jgi:hypothetical protein
MTQQKDYNKMAKRKNEEPAYEQLWQNVGLAVNDVAGLVKLAESVHALLNIVADVELQLIREGKLNDNRAS